MADETQKILLTRQHAAMALDVSLRTIDNLIKSKALRPRKIRGRVLFLKSDLEKLAKAGTE